MEIIIYTVVENVINSSLNTFVNISVGVEELYFKCHCRMTSVTLDILQNLVPVIAVRCLDGVAGPSNPSHLSASLCKTASCLNTRTTATELLVDT